MGGFGSGRFGRRSTSHLDIEYARVSTRDLSRAGLWGSLPPRLLATSTPLEVELNGTDETQLKARPSVGTSTGTAPWSFPREGNHVPPALWFSIDSLFVELVGTGQHFGGRRIWFRCPRARCGRRCSVLYRPLQCNARAFACRKCHELRYTSQRIAAPYRLERRADRILDPLTADGELPRKPKGMHHATYQRRLREAEKFLARSRWLLRFRPFGI